MFPFNGRFHEGSVLFVNVDWCGYCRDARPILEEVAQHLGHAVPVCDVNGDTWKTHLQQSFGERAPRQYPTIMYIGKDGVVSTFEEERSVESLLAWICSKSSQQSGRIKACDTMDI